MPTLTNREIDAAADAEALVRLLIEAGERVPPRLRERILAAGPAVVAPLLAMIEDEELSYDTAPGEGWAPIHAVELLGELQPPEAIEPMIRRLAQSEQGIILHDELQQVLPKFGPAVLEPALAAHASGGPESRRSLCSVLAELGVRDDRVYDALLEIYEQDAVLGTIYLAQYGDPRALPLLSQALDDYEPSFSDDLMANQLAIELEDAIRRLGGEITPAQKEKLQRIYEYDQPRRERLGSVLERAIGQMDLERSPVRGARALTIEPQPARAARKIGRNDPCPCGSGKKFKKCCLGKDEG